MRNLEECPAAQKQQHWKTLKELRSLEDEVILPADKGNATVVMKRSDYTTRG